MSTDEKIPVLYIDDDLNNLRLVAKLLKNTPYEVELATDGLAGIEAAKLRKPRIIITDLHMPELSGRATMRKIREHKRLKHIPIVVLTADTSATLRREVLEIADAYIEKPIGKARLVDELDRLLEGDPSAPNPLRDHFQSP